MLDGLTPITAKKTAADFNVKVDTLVAWRHAKRGPKYIKFGRTIIYTEEWNREFLLSKAVDPAEQQKAPPVPKPTPPKRLGRPPKRQASAATLAATATTQAAPD